MSKSDFTRLVLAVSLAAIAGCALFPKPEPVEKYSLKLARNHSGRLPDGLDPTSLRKAADETIRYLKIISPATKMKLGRRTVTPGVMIESIETLVSIIESEPDEKKRARLIRRKFDIYKGTGKTDGGNALVTGYYQPLLHGSREKTYRYRWPLYGKPGDLVSADLGLFSKSLKGKRVAGKVVEGRLVPYATRRDIDRDGALAGRELEIVWVDDRVDIFFLQVQGSGIVRFENGREIFVNYAASNGREYRSIGKLLIGEGKISREDMSLQAIRKYLEERPEELERVLYHNPSYIFFRLMDDGPFGSTGAKLVAGRSAAFDPQMFPKGSLAYISFPEPEIAGGEITGYKETGRFVFSHDQGGAIKGAGRLDIFFGAGEEAEFKAGVMKHPGELLFLVLKEKVYAEIAESR